MLGLCVSNAVIGQSVRSPERSKHYGFKSMDAQKQVDDERIGYCKFLVCISNCTSSSGQYNGITLTRLCVSKFTASFCRVEKKKEDRAYFTRVRVDGSSLFTLDDIKMEEIPRSLAIRTYRMVGGFRPCEPSYVWRKRVFFPSPPSYSLSGIAC